MNRGLGTFRPDRIQSIADRFGVDGNMVLENILYGDYSAYTLQSGFLTCREQPVHLTASTKYALGPMRYHMYLTIDVHRWSSSTNVPCALPRTRTLNFL